MNKYYDELQESLTDISRISFYIPTNRPADLVVESIINLSYSNEDIVSVSESSDFDLCCHLDYQINLTLENLC